VSEEGPKKTPATLVIDCMASGTRAPNLVPKGFLIASTPKP
jgi:hypothetical protein